MAYDRERKELHNVALQVEPLYWGSTPLLSFPLPSTPPKGTTTYKVSVALHTSDCFPITFSFLANSRNQQI